MRALALAGNCPYEYLGYYFSILRVPSATKRRLLPVRHDSGTYVATCTSPLGRAAPIHLPLHPEHPHPAGAPTLQGQPAWAPAGGPARPNGAGLFEDRGGPAARSLFTGYRCGGKREEPGSQSASATNASILLNDHAHACQVVDW